LDIPKELCLVAGKKLRDDLPDTEMIQVGADFPRQFALPSPTIMPKRNVVYFPGSTIGNYTHEAAHKLLKVMHHEAGADGGLLIGVDLQKDPAMIERAYNDSEGVTARFNLNMLRHLNREFESDFDLDAWSHDAQYNRDEGRIELRLISSRDQTVNVGPEVISISAGEGILTEYSHKYTLDGFAAMAGRAGFRVAKVWMDADQLFSVQYCVRD